MQRIEGSGLDRVIRHLRRDRPTAAGSSSGGSTLAAEPARPAALVGQPEGATSPRSRLGERDRPVAALAEPRPPSRPGDGSAGGSAAWPRPRSADRDDEPPPFEPPRGSAYYRWVAEVGRAGGRGPGARPPPRA